MTTAVPPSVEASLDAFSEALEVLQDGFFVLDRAWRFVYVNRATARTLGAEPRDLLGEVLWERFPQLLGTAAEAAYRRAMTERVAVALELEGTLAERWYRIGISPTEAGIAVLWADITERKRMEAALRWSEERFAVIHDRAPFGIALTSLPEHRFVSVNDAWLQWFGYSRDQVLGRTTVEFGIADAETQAAIAREFEERGFVRNREVKGITASGEVKIVTLNLDEVEIGGRGHVLATVQDVTDRKKADDLLRERLATQEQLAQIAASVPGAICTFRQRPDGTACMPFAAEALDDLYGIPRAVLAQDMTPCMARVHPDDVSAVGASIAASERELTPWHAEYRYDHPAKGLRFIEGWSIPSRDPDGGTTWHGYVTDVTAKRLAEQALVEAERNASARAAELEAVLDTVPAAVWMTRDARGDMITGNRFAEEFVGRPRGLNMSLSAPEAERPTNYRMERAGVTLREDELPIQLAARRGAELRDVEFDVVFEDGSSRHMLGSAIPIRAGGRVSGAVGTFIDITDRKRAEEQLREEARRKDEFLAVLSHELRNPLAPIRNSIHLLEHAAPDSEVAGRARSVLRRQTDHLTRLVDDLLDVTRIARAKVNLRCERVDLRDVARKTADDLESLFAAAGVDLRVELTAKPIWIEADPTRIAQAVGNLLNNAVKFTPHGGTVLLTLGAVGDRAELRVVDDGAGIAPDHLPRLFQPFAQAEQGLARSRGGLGLGLAIVKGVVELHGGSVVAANREDGRGAEFTIRLPRIDPFTARPDGDARSEGVPRDILLVEDNTDAASTLSDILELDGHAVRVARGGRAGLAMAHEQRPDVILCDLGLPDLDGYAVARALRGDPALRQVRLIAVSGYAQPEDVAKAIAAGFDAHVSKPVDLDRLRQLIAAPGSPDVHPAEAGERAPS